MSAAPMETELKLRIPASALQRLSEDPALSAGEHVATEQLKAIYYDTPDLDLSGQGAALRVRREGDRWIQTLKWGGEVVSGLHRRNEIELEVPGPVPDIGRIGESEAHALFRLPHIASELQPVFETEFTRSRRLLVLGDAATIEASLDLGEIRSGDRREELSELELELKRGEVPALFRLALDIAQRAPVFLEHRSKAERGYALFGHTLQVPVKASAPVLAGDTSVSDAFAMLAWESLSQLHANADGVLKGEDPEFLHQMRVAMRRLRSTLSAFSRALPPDADAKVKQDLRWLAARLGPARDWDVFVTETLPAVTDSVPDRDALGPLTTEVDVRRVTAQREVHRGIRSRRYQQILLEMALWLSSQAWRDSASDEQRATLESPVRPYAQNELERRYERVRKRGRELAHLDAAGRHKLRIAIKKLRYAVEFFTSLFDGEEAHALRAHLARLQDILGTMNDAATLQRLLGEVHAGTSELAMAEARGILLGWSAGRADALHQELERAWKGFRHCRTFW
jgi:inorganic triphosphatase YgiF